MLKYYDYLQNQEENNEPLTGREIQTANTGFPKERAGLQARIIMFLLNSVLTGFLAAIPALRQSPKPFQAIILSSKKIVHFMPKFALWE
jgi:hypothetical protein